MRFLKLAGLCTLVALVTSVAWCSSAFAAPKWFECGEGFATGAWKDAACSEADATKKSNFERLTIVPTGFTSLAHEVKLEVMTNVVTCKEETSSGEVEAPGAALKVTLKLFGCKGEETSTKKTCEVKSIKPLGGKEEVIINSLKGELGKVGKAEAASEVGLLLTPESGAVLTEMEGSCLSLTKFPLEGGLISEVTPASKVQGTAELIAKPLEKKQKIQKFEGGAQKVIKTTLGVEVSVNMANKLTFENAEIGAGESVAPRPVPIYAWKVKTFELPAGEKRPIIMLKAGVAGLTIQSKVGAVAFTVKCTALNETAGTNTEIAGGKGGSGEETWTLTGCTMPTPANCNVEAEKIVTKKLGIIVGQGLGRSAGKVVVSLGSNETAPSFMTIKAVNNGGVCGVAGSIVVEGSVLAEALDPGVELFTQEFSFEPVLKTGVAAFIINRVRNIRAGLRVGAEQMAITGLMSFSVTEGGVEQEFSPK